MNGMAEDTSYEDVVMYEFVAAFCDGAGGTCTDQVLLKAVSGAWGAVGDAVLDSQTDHREIGKSLGKWALEIGAVPG